MTKLMITTIAVLSFFGCSKAQQNELLSVHYHRSGMSIDDRISITVKKTTESYIVKFEEGQQVEDKNSQKFEITQSEFDSLANIVLQMSKPGKVKFFVHDLNKSFDVTFTNKGKVETRNYSIGQIMNKKTAELQNQAVGLIKNWINNYKKQLEIRVSYSKGIATPTKICIHAEPADLVEDLGEFVEYSNPNENEKPGGSKDYTHRWKALKPGKVNVWLQEVGLDYDPNNLTKDFAPNGCYMIDENLNVSFLKEETEIAKNKFNENN